jgi:ADP-heptose:LPS heptosyltransferase
MTPHSYRRIHGLIERTLERAAKLMPSPANRPITSPPARVLAVKFGGLGDGVIVRSILEQLHALHPQVRIDVLVDPKSREVMSCASDARVWFYDPQADGVGRAIRLLVGIRRSRYDAALNFEQHSTLAAGFIRAAAIPIRVGLAPPRGRLQEKFLTHSVPWQSGDSVWSATAALVRVLYPALPAHPEALPIPYGPDAGRWASEWLAAQPGGRANHIVAMHLGVGARAQYKKWPLERYVELADRLRDGSGDLDILLTGTAAERPLIDNFRTSYGGPAIDGSVAGSIERCAALLDRSDLIVSADTGMMHLGAAMGTPTVGLFGASNSRCWGPVGPRATHLYRTRVSCSPCIDSYLRIIPERCTASSMGICMKEISVDDVIEAARSVIVGGWLG